MADTPQQDQLRISKDDKFIIFHIDGGHGKGIMATAVVSALKKKYPNYKIIVATAWDAPWYFNPDVFRVYNFGQMPYFYDNYVFDETIILRQDPYHTEDHIKGRKHLLQTWCDMFDIPYNGEQPKLYLNPRELEIARDKIKPDQGKPIMLLQTHGGMPQHQYSKKSWARDMPVQIAQSVVNYFAKSYRILHIRLEDQPALQNVEPLNLPHRELYGVFTLSKKRLFIDSFAQHTAAALGLPSTVAWIVNKPEIFGYQMHQNILPNAELVQNMNKFSYVDQYDISGQVQQFPYDTVNLFDTNQIISTVREQ
jgi:hypothetical protein